MGKRLILNLNMDAGYERRYKMKENVLKIILFLLLVELFLFSLCSITDLGLLFVIMSHLFVLWVAIDSFFEFEKEVKE